MRVFERYFSYKPRGIEWIGDIPNIKDFIATYTNESDSKFDTVQEHEWFFYRGRW